MAFNEAFPMERNADRSAVPARRSGPPCSAASWLLVLGAHLLEHLEVLAAVVGGEVAGRERDPMDRAAEAGDPLESRACAEPPVVATPGGPAGGLPGPASLTDGREPPAAKKRPGRSRVSGRRWVGGGGRDSVVVPQEQQLAKR